MMICTALCAAMIYQACGLDKQKQNICLPTNVLLLLAGAYGFRAEIFVLRERRRTGCTVERENGNRIKNYIKNEEIRRISTLNPLILHKAMAEALFLTMPLPFFIGYA